ncbi:hypothetical protein QR680_010017 [Steinernema hermaphroditum]|uniref:MSP domain-containing protein n=1 Tax=Steinernema hermaphroditum TaxID=289476 RepID=A0AA39IMF1_9BILA|nr:hypothetical protein QR680_010017 [Steinernema hermaphroditum]
MNYDRLVNFVVRTDGLFEDLRALQNDSKTYLQADRCAIIFEGFSEISRLCSHVNVTNTSKRPVAFNVRKPDGSSFGVDQKLGIVMPGESMQLYFQFRGRGSRIPDDGVHIYTIYQTTLRSQEVSYLDSCEYWRDRYLLARKIWSSYTGDCAMQLHLPVGFEAKRSSNNFIHPPHKSHWKWRDEKITKAPAEASPPDIAGCASVHKSCELPSAAADDALLKK